MTWGGLKIHPFQMPASVQELAFRKILAPRMVKFLWASCRGPSPRIPPESTHITSKVWDDQACTMHATSWQSLSETLILLDAMSILGACLSSKVLLGHQNPTVFPLNPIHYINLCHGVVTPTWCEAPWPARTTARHQSELYQAAARIFRLGATLAPEPGSGARWWKNLEILGAPGGVVIEVRE